MSNRREVLLGVAGWALGGRALAQSANDPRAIVEQIYKISAGPDGKYEGRSIFQQPRRKQYFTKSLNAALDAMDRKSKRTNEPILDFDPITDSQDPSVTKLTITTESATPAKAVVAAKFFMAGAKDATLVRYVLLLEGGSWKVDDMSGGLAGQSGWNLRNVIK